MPLFEVAGDGLIPIDPTRFAAHGVRERDDLQRILLKHLDVVCPGAMPLCEEFGDWEESRRRIDILALDSDANLIVVELKRTESGGRMDLQAIRYAAMVSKMTFEQAVAAHQRWLDSTEGGDAEQRILQHLSWDEADDERFGQEVRIVLVSADFSREVTSTALWLSERDIDISCVRLRPYEIGGKLVLDVQRLIPLPEAADYVERVQSKARAERTSRKDTRDNTKFDVRVGDEVHEQLPKRRAMLVVVRQLCASGVSPEEISEVIAWRERNLWFVVDGSAVGEAFVDAAGRQEASGGRKLDASRYFIEKDEVVRHGGRTYALSSQWGPKTAEALRLLMERWPDAGVEVKAVGA